MALPKNERRTVTSIDRRTMWIYGAPYSGKTYLANTFPDVLMLNTDGNIKFVDAPYVPIRDTMEGRVPKCAWENFKNTIDDLAHENGGFKTIVVDLLEDTYQYCRQFVFAREGYTHESDGGYGKGWQLVDDEFIPTIKKLLNLDYENIILISHEVKGDVTKKNSDKITTIMPNMRDKVALKISGMVDFTGRFVADGDEREVQIKASEFVFGGGRAGFVGKNIPATYEAICGLYDVDALVKDVPAPVEPSEPSSEPVTAPAEDVKETPKKRKVRARKDDGE